MRGVYTFFKDGKEVASVNNLITDMAKPALLDFLAGKTRTWAGAVVVGIGDDAAQAANKNINFEVYRSEVTVKEPRYDEGAIVCKATMPLDLIAQISEIGLINTMGAQTRDANSYILNQFNPEVDNVSLVEPVEGRFGAVSSQLTLGSPTQEVVVDDLSIELSGLSPRDEFKIALDASAGISVVTVRFYNQNNNFRSQQIAINEGFETYSFDASELTGTGSLEEVVSRIGLVVSGTPQSTLQIEGMRFYSSGFDEGEVLMSHAILEEPIIKGAGEELDVEFKIVFGGLDGN